MRPHLRDGIERHIEATYDSVSALLGPPEPGDPTHAIGVLLDLLSEARWQLAQQSNVQPNPNKS